MDKEIFQEEPKNINPEITQNFAEFIKERAEQGIYRVEVGVGEQAIPIDVFPTVFPPKSDYSVSSRSVYEAFGNLEGLEVADIGSGSGVESIVAVMAGARHVDAADINPNAVECSKHNVAINGMSDSIDVFCSDLFSNFPKKKYDLIIANLPIVNYDVDDNPINQALYDEGFETHKRLFTEARDYLTDNGIITFTHANLQSAETVNPDYDFIALESLIGKYGYKIIEKTTREDIGYKWINYKLNHQA